VPLHKSRKSRPGTAPDVVFQQLPIDQPCPILQKHRPAKVLDDHAHLSDRHVPFLFFNVPPTLAGHSDTAPLKRASVGHTCVSSLHSVGRTGHIDFRAQRWLD
jgi:hypothetical protein